MWVNGDVGMWGSGDVSKWVGRDVGIWVRGDIGMFVFVLFVLGCGCDVFNFYKIEM